MAICAYNLALLNLLLQFLKSNFPPKTSDTKQFILFTPMMEIKYSGIFYPTPPAPSLLLVVRKPLIVTSN